MTLSWTYEPLIAEAIARFVAQAMPDAEDGWETGAYEIHEAEPTSPDGEAWIVAYDVPTTGSSLGVWLSFVIDKEIGSDAVVRDVNAIREGICEEDTGLYVWADEEGAWMPFEDNDSDEIEPWLPPMRVIRGGREC